MSFHSYGTIFVKGVFFRGLYHCSESKLFQNQNSTPSWTALELTTLAVSCLLQGRMPEKAEGNFLVIPVRFSKKKSTNCFQTEEIHGMVHKQMPLGKLRDTNCVPAGQRQLEFHQQIQVDCSLVFLFFKPFLHNLTFLLFYYHHLTKVSQYLLIPIISILSESKCTSKNF